MLISRIRPDTRYYLQCWGDFSLVCTATGRDITPRGRKIRALLAYLVMHADRRISRERLTSLFWGERADAQARSSLRQALFELRDVARGATPLLTVTREHVILASSAVETDLSRLAEVAETDGYAALIELLPDRDDTLFADLNGIDAGFDDWLTVERVAQVDRLQSLVAASAGRAAAAKDHAAARSLSTYLAYHPATDAPVPTAAMPTLGPPPAPAAEEVRSGWLKPPSRPLLLAGVLASLAGAVVIAARPNLQARGMTSSAGHQEAAALYQSAKALIRSREYARLGAAAELLERAVSMDPDFARGWAALATVRGMLIETPEQRLEAEKLARRAVALDPRLAEAHGALGMVLGFASAEAGAHLKRAAALDPNDAQIQFWLSNHYQATLDFAAHLNALRRVVALDPSWGRGTSQAALAAWQMGARDEARRYVERLRRFDPEEAFVCHFQLDTESGDLAAAARRLLAARTGVRQPEAADRKLGGLLLMLGHSDPGRLLMRLPDAQSRVAFGERLTAANFVALEAKSDTDWYTSNQYLPLALQRLLDQGRAAEIVALFDGRGKGELAGMKHGGDPLLRVAIGPEVALALQAVGRGAEGRALLDELEATVSRAYARGHVPAWFDAAAARLWAARGDRARALTALRRAVDRGWIYAPIVRRPDLQEVASFAGLRTDPGFQAIRARLLARLEAEQRKLGPVRI